MSFVNTGNCLVRFGPRLVSIAKTRPDARFFCGELATGRLLIRWSFLFTDNRFAELAKAAKLVKLVKFGNTAKPVRIVRPVRLVKPVRVVQPAETRESTGVVRLNMLTVLWLSTRHAQNVSCYIVGNVLTSPAIRGQRTMYCGLCIDGGAGYSLARCGVTPRKQSTNGPTSLLSTFFI